MTSVSGLTEVVAEATLTPKPRAVSYAARLRDLDVLPRSSGRAVAHVDNDHAIALLLACALAPLPRETGRTVRKYADLTCHSDRAVSLTRLLEREMDRSAAGDHSVTEIVLLHEEPAALVRLELDGEEQTLRFGDGDDWPALPRRTLIHVYGDAFATVARSLT
ncbi:hypothetical protein ACFSCV_01760 [Methylopila henanensis]|uniref:Uncharacterized protein n=1 Tax=Methylopila henanensis TaxID=873516 RepID=A0ABW4K256_9HYPH